MGPGRRKRVLIVNCYMPETREPMQLPNEMPMPLAPIHLAGYFAPSEWDIRIYNEVSHGWLEVFQPALLDWPDAVVFCGLTASFDRFRHLSAYIRTRNPAVVTIAGGLAMEADWMEFCSDPHAFVPKPVRPSALLSAARQP